jgi:hypothetical protein
LQSANCHPSRRTAARPCVVAAIVSNVRRQWLRGIGTPPYHQSRRAGRPLTQ